MSPTATEALSRPIANPITGGIVAPDFELEVIKNDVDVDRLILDLMGFKKYSVNVRASVTAADVELSIDGAHSLTITIRDTERSLAASGVLDYAVGLDVAGWGWTLVKRNKSGDDLTLTFEPRVTSWLRAEVKRIKARRGKVTRAEFVLMLIRAAKKRRIKLYCPELHKVQPIAKASQQDSQGSASRREPGLDNKFAIKIDGKKADTSVMRNLERILKVGDKKGARRKVQVATMMTVLQESRGRTSATNGIHVGLFQQDPHYWPATREPERDADAWYNRVMAWDKSKPDLKLTSLIEAIQQSGQPANYAGWRNEAEDIVTHFYGSKADASITVSRKKPYEFRVQKGENYWATIIRLAGEVDWSVFTIKDTVYFIAQEDLYKSKSRLTIAEGKDGVDYIDYDDDDRKVTQQVTVACRMKMWTAPLGSVVTIDDPGLPKSCQGRYLVTDLQRSYFSTAGSVTLTRPQESKPEPPAEIVTKTITTGPGSDAANSDSNSDVRAKLIKYAKSTLTSKTGFKRYNQSGAMTLDPTPRAPARTDCSQWTRAIFHHVTGFDIGINTWAQISNGKRTTRPQPGDLMFPTGGGHVEIYLGGSKTIGHGSPPIDYGDLSYWPSHFFITFDFLDGGLTFEQSSSVQAPGSHGQSRPT